MNYKDSRWKHKRVAILRRDHYICQESKRYGKSVPGNTVHHIYPAEYYPEIKYESWNLISLSDSAHNEMHYRDTHQVTEKGKRWQEKVKDKFIRWYEERGLIPPTFEN